MAMRPGLTAETLRRKGFLQQALPRHAAVFATLLRTLMIRE
jgi:hypothetical protein